MKRFVYNQKYARLLVSMKDETSQIDELARRIHANAGHLRIVLDQWHKEGVIVKDKPGRDYQIQLTKKGNAISQKLAELMDLDNNWKEKPDPIVSDGTDAEDESKPKADTKNNKGENRK
jgi:predicted transcriptional regulator